jgi:YHS domain-containing protein
MERESFTHPLVREHAEADFVPVKLRSDHHEELAIGFGLSGLPATVILRPTGEVVASAQGFLDPGSLTNVLRRALQRVGQWPATAVTTAARTALQASREHEPALGGYCPVTLVDEHQLVAGKAAVSIEHDSRVYRFGSERALDRFKRQPERYVPVNGGRCPVAQVDRGDTRPGSPFWGVLYEGHLYLCGDEAGRQRFLRHPERYAHVDVADRGFCPHCMALDGLLVRGRSEVSLTRGGRRFLFPDPSHLEAFRGSDDTTRR